LVDIGASAQKDLEASQAEQQALAEAVHAQQSTVAGLEGRLKRFGVSDPASSQSAITLLRAPFAGVVLDIDSAPGAVIDSSSELLSIADLSSVYVEAQVYEKDMGHVRIGQPASITTDSYPGTHFTGRVTSIGDQIDPQTRTTPVRCEVSNRGAKLKLNMFAGVALPTTSQRSGLAVPTDAVQDVEGKKVIFIRRSPTQFEIRQVTLGRASDGMTEIASGLKEGEEVVTRGAFQVKSALLSKELGEKD
jgi:cobalt-zinc-cadmium efflux system membrane fusion protein